MKNKKKKFNQKGFTLIEIMIVLAIIGVIFSFVGVNVIKKFGEAKVQAAKIQISGYQQSLNSYWIHNSVYPDTSQGLQALISKPGSGKIPTQWNGPYFQKKELVPDPWGNPYRYVCENYQDYVITSDGPDGQQGNEDDVSSDN